jgi:histidine triad (HIT) family protein
MVECIFCQIIRGELPCAKIYEDERVISFLDINPINGGHTLVLPKIHYATLFDVSPEDLQACAAVSQKIGVAVFKVTNASGLNLIQNNYRTAGQLIDHIHFHLIPRFHQDNFLGAWPRRPYQQGGLGKMLKKIKAEL